MRAWVCAWHPVAPAWHPVAPVWHPVAPIQSVASHVLRAWLGQRLRGAWTQRCAWTEWPLDAYAYALRHVLHYRSYKEFGRKSCASHTPKSSSMCPSSSMVATRSWRLRSFRTRHAPGCNLDLPLPSRQTSKWCVRLCVCLCVCVSLSLCVCLSICRSLSFSRSLSLALFLSRSLSVESLRCWLLHALY
jgi:hypothetical protein